MNKSGRKIGHIVSEETRNKIRKSIGKPMPENIKKWGHNQKSTGERIR